MKSLSVLCWKIGNITLPLLPPDHSRKFVFACTKNQKYSSLRRIVLCEQISALFVYQTLFVLPKSFEIISFTAGVYCRSSMAVAPYGKQKTSKTNPKDINFWDSSRGRKSFPAMSLERVLHNKRRRKQIMNL